MAKRKLLDLDGKDLEAELEKILASAKPSYKTWTQKEDYIIQRLYGKVSADILAAKLGASRRQIYYRAEQLGVLRRK